MLGQMASHKLFAWSVGVIKQLYAVVIESDRDRAPMFRPFLSSFDPIWFERMHLTEPSIEGPLQSWVTHRNKGGDPTSKQVGAAVSPSSRRHHLAN
jgi:hypothetical protein